MDERSKFIFDTFFRSAAYYYCLHHDIAYSVHPLLPPPQPSSFAPPPSPSPPSIHLSIYLLSWFPPRFMCSSNNESNEKYYDLIALFAALLPCPATPPPRQAFPLPTCPTDLATPHEIWPLLSYCGAWDSPDMVKYISIFFTSMSTLQVTSLSHQLFLWQQQHQNHLQRQLKTFLQCEPWICQDVTTGCWHPAWCCPGTRPPRLQRDSPRGSRKRVQGRWKLPSSLYPTLSMG